MELSIIIHNHKSKTTLTIIPLPHSLHTDPASTPTSAALEISMPAMASAPAPRVRRKMVEMWRSETRISSDVLICCSGTLGKNHAKTGIESPSDWILRNKRVIYAQTLEYVWLGPSCNFPQNRNNLENPHESGFNQKRPLQRLVTGNGALRCN